MKIYLLLWLCQILCITHCNGQLNPIDTSSNPFRQWKDFSQKRTIIKFRNEVRIYELPQQFGFLKQVPGDLACIFKTSIHAKGLLWTAAVAAGSFALIKIDQPAIDWIRETSRLLGISDQTTYKVLIRAGNTKVLQLPRNGTTLFYQLGQGGTSLLLAGGLWTYGKLAHDYRAVSTAGDIASTFVTLAILTQAIKRISGRESPFVATTSGGKWTPFPSFSEYQRNTPGYDAFPSGHLATLMATITVLSENYPEKKWIKPVGYSLMGVCMWTMANIEVHWIGDYPLAIAIGYLSGKISTMRHKSSNHKNLLIY